MKWTKNSKLIRLGFVFILVSCTTCALVVFINARRTIKPHIAPTSQSIATHVEPDKPKEVVLSTEKMLVILNQYRADVGLPPLQAAPELAQSAMEKCRDMQNGATSPTGSRYSYFAHQNPETGEHGYAFAQRDFPGRDRYGENLIEYFFKDEATPMQAWFEHEEHKENMLRPEYTYTGLAYCNESTYDEYSGRFYIVEHFSS